MTTRYNSTIYFRPFLIICMLMLILVSIPVSQAQALALPPASMPPGEAGLVYSSGGAIQATGGSGNYAYAFVGAPFVGLTINPATGEITGTPSSPADEGSNIFNVQVTDTTTTDTVTQTYSLFIFQQLRLNNPTLANATRGLAYNENSILVTGGQPAYNFSAVGLPDGLIMNAADGSISGTPSAIATAGVNNVDVTVTDNQGGSAMRTYTIDVREPVMLPAFNAGVTPLNGFDGVAYTFTFIPTGGNGNYTFNIQSGALPSGLSLNTASGTVSGTPTASGNFTFTLRVVDDGGTEDTESYTISIVSANVQFTSPLAMVDGVVGDPYPTVTLSALGGIAPYTFTVASLPPGVTCTNCNVATAGSATLSGTPTTAGTFNVQLTVTDSTPGTPTTDIINFSVTILAAANITLNTSNVGGGTQGVTYTGSITATGGTAPYTFAVTSGTLPPGITLNADGTFTGTPTTVGSSTFDVTATDANANTGTGSVTINVIVVNMQLTPATFPDFIIGQNYNVAVQATGGQAPYTYQVTANMFLGGLNFNNAGDPAFVTGTPTQAATYTVTIQATDANANTVSRTYTVNMTNPPVLSVQPAGLSAGLVNQTYPATTITATGSAEPYTLAIISGSLPTGLNFNAATGVISGTPTTAGTFTFTIRATFATAGTAQRSYTITVTADNQVRLNASPGTGSTIDFGEVSIGETATRTITIAETGSNTVTVSVPPGGLITGEHAPDFTITAGSPPFSIPNGGAAVQITIQCEPAASGTRTATLTLATNDPTQPTLTYALVCNGIQLIIGDVEITRLDILGDSVVTGVVGQVTQVKGLALRSGPYLGASMLGVIRPERDYLILAYNDTEGNANGQGPYPWYLLIDTFNQDRIGWASGRYLQVNGVIPFQDTIFDTAASAPYNRVELVIRGNSNVRLRPSERSREITAPTDYGVTVRAYARTVQAGLTQWILIDYQGQRGWVRYNPATMEVAEPGLYGLDALRIW